MTNVALIAKKILDRLTASFMVAGHEIFVSASLGISWYPDDGQNAATLIQNADAAMYAGKQGGKNCLRRGEPVATVVGAL